MNKQKVYRAGSMTPSPDAGAAYEVTAAADDIRHIGQRSTGLPARLGGLFAAPTLPGVVRWVRGNDMCSYETRVREITVDADTTYVFQVDAWEDINDEHDTDSMDDFWATAMTLTDWLAQADAREWDGADWEVIFPPTAVLSVRNVSAPRLMAVTDSDWLPEIQRVTRRWAREDRNRRALAA